MTKKAIFGLCLSLILLGSLSAKVSNAETDQRISQMAHTSWTGRDGAPQAIHSLAQTPDGILWIGSVGGLYSFDGFDFTVFRPRSGLPSFPFKTIRSLMVSREGDLWVNGWHGAVTRVRHGVLKTFDRVRGESIDSIGSVQEDAAGTVWAVSNNRQLLRLGEDEVWDTMVDPSGTVGHISALFIDSAGTQWVVENDWLYRKALLEAKFTRVPIEAQGVAELTEAADHTLWIIGQTGKAFGANGKKTDLQHVDKYGRPIPVGISIREVDSFTAVPDGSLWIIEAERGLRRLPSSSRREWPTAEDLPDVYGPNDGLTSDQETTMFRDRDGNIWVGGLRGLDQFRRALLVSAVGATTPGTWLTCVSSTNEVWVARNGGGLFALRNGHRIGISGLKNIYGMICGEDSSVWLRDGSGIARVRNRNVERIPLLPGQPRYLDHYMFTGLVSTNNELIASVGGALKDSLWRFRNGRWQQFSPGRPFRQVAAMSSDTPNGLLYLGHRDGTLTVVKNGSASTLSTGTPGLGAIVGFSKTSRGFIAYGENGVAIERSNRFQMLSFQHPESVTTVTGFVESRNGDFWINGSHGIVRVFKREIEAALIGINYRMNSIEVHEGDFIGPDYFGPSRSSAAIDADGKLWFATLNGVIYLDEQHLMSTQALPKLSLRGVQADGKWLDSTSILPSNAEVLDFHYLGLNLSNPKGVIYKYRLSSVDTAWEAAGNRRDAIYTHLKPGNYVFQVMASNSAGNWTAPVSLPFRLMPKFYQTWWFDCLLCLACAALIWWAIHFRIKYATGIVRIRAEERADERVRIARELHDTLLQGLQGLMLNFHVAAQKLSYSDESRELLEKSLATADRLIVEGRNRVACLRSEDLEEVELFASIEKLALELNMGPEVRYVVEKHGISATLRASLRHEIFYIAREAVSNALRHAQASEIRVDLEYHKKWFALSCRDNGHGFDAIKSGKASDNGHWGLRGMIERAQDISGNLRIQSGPEKGTRVFLSVRSPYT